MVAHVDEAKCVRRVGAAPYDRCVRPFTGTGRNDFAKVVGTIVATEH